MIPTSFVPHPGASAAERGRSSFGFSTILVVLAYLSLAVALVAAGGVFAYSYYLTSVQAGKDAALAQATASLDQATIQGFLTLHDRLGSAKTLLANHVELSGLFDLLESVTPGSVRFSSVNVTLDDTGAATLQAAGTAKNFNALAAASNYFGTDARLKNAIFSNITIGSGGTVSFSLSATLAPQLIAYTAPTGAAMQPAPATTTPASLLPASVPVSGSSGKSLGGGAMPPPLPPSVSTTTP